MSGPKRSEPEASRPHMPGYGILDAESGRGLLPWSWARDRLEQSHNYWISTARPGGRPHTTAVWGLWRDDIFYFSMAANSRKAQNLAGDPHCVVCTERADEAVITEGVFETVTDDALLEQLWQAYKAKYDWDMADKPFYEVRPRVAFAFIEASDEFADTATRWRFPDD